jgi:RimK family alpha-L-glutamate ligase
MKKVMATISNVDDLVNNYPQAFAYHEGDSIEILLVDYANIEIRNGKDLKIYCRGEEIGIPDVFFPKMVNTDAYIFENMLLNAGVESVINLEEKKVTQSKIATYQRLAANGIRIPESIVFFNHPDMESIKQKLGYPFVVKPDNGFGGEGVELIHNDEEFSEYIKTLRYGVAYVAQEYIATSRGKDVRVVMYKGEVFYNIMRSATDPNEFRSNVHVGGEMLNYDLDDKTVELCKKIASLFDLPIIGIDLMIGDGEFVVAEINSSPGLPNDRDRKVMNEIINEYFEKHK